jgi:hypothetical protein
MESVMAGKAGRSGRPKGSLSWYQNPTARAGSGLNVLVEHRLAVSAERRFTVPPKDKRALAEQAIRLERDSMMELEKLKNPEVVAKVAAIDVDAVLAWSRRLAPQGPSLRRKVGPNAYDEYVERISNAWKGVDK